MKNKKIIFGVAIIFLTIIAVIKNNNQSPTAQTLSNPISEDQNTSTVVSDDNLMSKTQINAEKIEVVHFHGTHQCWSCITVGEYALKTIKEKFPEEYKDGTVVYKDINVELPENRDIVMKYRAGGSSLFINAIKNGTDNIEEDVTVWRLVTNEDQYISYFQNTINGFLGK
ncbi:MAG: nitrophenyl compound nitroreductase subunit ArsF family protein [Patescibacteria group bacterium]|nr:hypothetical protein [Patescibacteria group bacterium]MBU1876908.1 hypothetical protein [Patescibacteria group bacterium]